MLGAERIGPGYLPTVVDWCCLYLGTLFLSLSVTVSVSDCPTLILIISFGPRRREKKWETVFKSLSENFGSYFYKFLAKSQY